MMKRLHEDDVHYMLPILKVMSTPDLYIDVIILLQWSAAIIMFSWHHEYFRCLRLSIPDQAAVCTG